MRPFSFYILFFTCLIFEISFGQKKILHAVASGDITVDGKFDEPIWEFAPIATDFVMFSPDNGKPENPARKSEVQIAYNDDAIYVAAKLYDDEPAKILHEITARDNFGTAEHFGVFINGLNDSHHDFRFFVSAAGVQMDCLFTNKDGEDFTWDAIWASKAVLTDYGWAVEMKIPYAALRFAKNEKQTWGVNFYREVRRFRQLYTWNFIDAKINNESAQSGILEGIDNIKTPTRLFLIPYTSYYVNTNAQQKVAGDLRGGLDIKYGISNAFTLDAILVPDFGQTKFDNVELYLGPFEQQFTENRPFFTEGTDLFSKGNLVYTRRIGQTPYIPTGNNEVIQDKPTSIKLINAVKVSGRTKNGLGIGVLNAVTENTSVTLRDTLSGARRNITIEPATNYNVLVLDQRFRKNSSVSLVNTNVTRNGSYRDANVSALVYDLNTKENTYKLNGDFKYSYLSAFGDKTTGVNTSMTFSETSGKFRYYLGGQYVSKDYDNNDLGLTFQTHYHSLNAGTSYRILNPTKKFNSLSLFLDAYSEFENYTGRLQTGRVNLSFNSTDKKNDYYGWGLRIRPLETYDFYESNTYDLQYFTIPKNMDVWVYISSNYNRKFALDFNPIVTFFDQKKRITYGFTLSPRYRVNDHLTLIYTFDFTHQENNTGNADFNDPNTIFARRNRSNYTNSLQCKYAINNKMTINLSARHYWAQVNNQEYMTLQPNGSLSSNPSYHINKDQNLNLWNADLSYSWWFAPGSQLTLLYRNNATNFNRLLENSFARSLSQSVNHEQLNHIFSISLRYFIDYNQLRR